jgi:thioredoxin reductase (NADPH)
VSEPFPDTRRSGGAVELTVYSRAYCHLCHDMLAALEVLRGECGFALTVLDVDSDPVLEARYGELVPVLMHGGHELARYRLDPSIVRAYLRGIR